MLEGGHLVQKAVLIGMGFSESAINDAIAKTLLRKQLIMEIGLNTTILLYYLS